MTGYGAPFSVASCGRRLKSGSPERSSCRVARSPRSVSAMRTPGCSVSTEGRAPVASVMRSQMASFTRSDEKRVLRRLLLVPWAVTAMVAPGARICSQHMSLVPAYRSSASRHSKRSSTTSTRLARRDHKQARSPSTASPAKETRPLSLRTWLSPSARSSSASASSNPAGQVAKNSMDMCPSYRDTACPLSHGNTDGGAGGAGPTARSGGSAEGTPYIFCVYARYTFRKARPRRIDAAIMPPLRPF